MSRRSWNNAWLLEIVSEMREMRAISMREDASVRTSHFQHLSEINFPNKIIALLVEQTHNSCSDRLKRI